nr:response regulator [Aeromonas salmonicida]
MGVDAEVVDDGEKALRTWQGQDFALLLTDCHMPVMDGYTLTRTLRGQGNRRPSLASRRIRQKKPVCRCRRPA